MFTSPLSLSFRAAVVLVMLSLSEIKQITHIRISGSETSKHSSRWKGGEWSNDATATASDESAGRWCWREGTCCGTFSSSCGRLLIYAGECSRGRYSYSLATAAAAAGGIIVVSDLSFTQMCYTILRICKRIHGLSLLIPVWLGE